MGQTTRDKVDEADLTYLTAIMLTLKGMRINCGMSQQQVAEAMGTTQSAVSEFERLEMLPNVTTLLRYARAVGGRLQLAVTVGEPSQSDDPA